MKRLLPLLLLLSCKKAQVPEVQDPCQGAKPKTVEPLPVPAPPDLRLPGDVKPARIALDLTIVPSKDTFAGVMTADAFVVQPTSVVWLNANGLEITSAKIDGHVVGKTQKNGFLGLALREELPIGEVQIEVAFEAPIDHAKSLGVYAEEEGGEAYAYTFFEPVDARRAFPCWDEPSYKIPWQLTFHVQADHVALANAPVASETLEDGGMKRVELEESRPMPSYLVAFVVGPFDVVDGGTGGRAQTPIRFVIPKGRGEELRYAKEVTPKVVAALEDYFDIDYPYGKLDVAVVPRFWGTMEHPGIVAMGQPLTLIPPDQETRERRQSYANILAHELGHYWFGDYVTMAWWDDTWLNEALGEWLDMRITDVAEPAWKYPEDRVGLAAWGMGADEVLAARQIRQPVDSLEGIQASFDNGITYAKGSVVLRMFEQFVGEDAWRTFLRAYVRQYAWGNATSQDFVGVMRAQLGDEVADGFTSFLDQPGVPRIAVSETCEVTQERALPAGTTDTARTWTLPVCIKWPGGEHCEIVSSAKASLSLEKCPQQKMLNRGAYGYYRSVYTAAEAKALLAAPKKKSKAKPWLTSVERRMIVTDVRAGVDRAEIPVEDALGLVSALAADADMKVAATGLSLLSLVEVRALDDDRYAQLRRFVVKALGPLANKLGWTRGTKDTDEIHALRLRVVPWVAVAGDAKLAKQGTKLARQWLADRKSVPDDIADAALDVAAATGDAALFDDVLAAARASTDHREQGRLLGALAGFRDPSLAEQALGVVISGEFDLRETSRIVYGILATRETREVAWKFVSDNIDTLLGAMREDEAGGAIAGFTSMICDQPHRDAAAALFQPRVAAIPGAENAFTAALEGVDQCIAAQARNLDGISKFLAKY